MVGERVVDANFLDLFAGTAIFSFEALSRGAAKAVAVDLSRKAADAIRDSASKMGLIVEVIASDSLSALKRLDGRAFDVVYCDPPYDYDRYDELLVTLATSSAIADDAVIGIEHSSIAFPFSRIPEPVSLRKTASYGTVAISLFDKEPAAPAGAAAEAGDRRTDGADTE